MNYFPKELVAITEFLATQKELDIKKSGEGEDGRINSAKIEREVIKLLENQNRWKIESPDSRYWYDFSVFDKNNQKFFVNIKISTCSNVDNTNCTGGIYYILTGKTPPKSMIDIVPKIKSNMKENNNDYYFLVIKKPTRKNDNYPNSFLCSLKTLKIIKPAGNNLPFQCHWGQNIEHHPRSYQEAYNFILKSYGKSLRQRAERYESFKKYFPDIDLEDALMLDNWRRH